MPLELERKAGPLPVWGWAVVVAVAGFVMYKKFLHGGSSATSNAVLPPGSGTGDAGGGGTVPVFIGGSGGTGADTTGTGTDTGNSGNPETNTWAYNLAHGLVPSSSSGKWDQPGGVPGGNVLITTPLGGAYPGLFSIGGVVFYNPLDPASVASKQKFDADAQSYLASLPLGPVTPTNYRGPQPGQNGVPPALAPQLPGDSGYKGIAGDALSVLNGKG